MESERINEIIGLILANEASDHEEQIFEKWLRQSEENLHNFEIIKQEWEANKPFYKIINAREIKEKIWKEGIGSAKREQRKSFRKLSFYVKIAAAFVLFISATVVIIKFNKTLPGVNIEQAWVTKINPPGQKSKVFLPGGSEVWLNAGSQLRYPGKFTDSARVVHLKGEAFFEVVKDTHRPFTVISNNVSTTALGTSFNVNAFNKGVEIALVSGKVKVVDMNEDNPIGDQLILEPGQAALFKNGDRHFSINEFDMEAVVGWKDGVLHFSEATFNEVIDKLELWYDVQIILKGEGAIRKHYTGKFNNENLRNVLESMSFVLGFEFELKDKTVIIYVD